MEVKKLITWIPIVAAVLGTIYTGINTIIKLNNTIEQHTIAISNLEQSLGSIDERYKIEIKNLTQKYTEGREELFREVTFLNTEIAQAKAKVEALDNSYYKVNDAVRDLGYELKDFKREVTGDY